MGPSANPLLPASPKSPPASFNDPSTPSATPPLKPVLDSFQLQGLKQELGTGGELGSPIVVLGTSSFRTNERSFGGLEKRLRELGASLGTLESEALTDAVKEIDHLETIERQLFQLSQLKIDNESVNAMRRDCAAKLLADVNNPMGWKDYEEGVALLQALQKFAGTEKADAKGRETMRQTLASLYPGGLASGYVFSLNVLDALQREEDPTRKPDWDTFENLDVIKVYNEFKESGDEEWLKSANAVDLLFSYLRDESSVGSSAELIHSASALNDWMDRRRAVLTDPALKPFFARIQELRKAKAVEDPDVKLSVDVSTALQSFVQAQGLTALLNGFETVASRNAPDKIRDALLKDCENFVKKGPETVIYLRSQGQWDLAKILEERMQDDVLAQQSVLLGLKTEEVTVENLTNVAKSLGQVSSIFRTAEEMKLKTALSDKLFRVIGKVGVGDLQARLEEITEVDMPDAAERLKAYQRIAAEIDKRSILFVAEVRAKQLAEMKKPVVCFFDLFENIGTAVPGPIGVGGRSPRAAFHEVAVAPRLKQYDEMIKAYADASELIKSDDPKEVLKGQRDFQRLEAAMEASGYNDLKEGSEAAVTGNQVIFVAVMVLAAIALAEAGPLIAVGGRGLMALLPLELGTQQLLATGLTYVVSGLLLTGVQHEVTGIMMPDADQGSFLEHWVLNTAMMGVGAVGMKAGQGAFAKGLEWLAQRRIAARMGSEIVVAGPSMGSAIETSVLAAEKEAILQGLTARFAQQATVFGAEYGAIQIFEYVKTVGQLSAAGVKDPESAAFHHVFSLKSQGMMAGFMVVMKAQGLTMAKDMDPMITDAAMKIEYKAIADSLNRELPKFRAEMEAAGLESPKDLMAHPELLQRAKSLLSLQTKMLSIKAIQNPHDIDAIGAWESATKIRNMADPAFKFMEGVETVFGESNAFGVRPLTDDGAGFAYTYAKGNQGKIVSKLRNVPGVDAARVRILPNGLIEIPFLATDLVPGGGTVRLMPSP